MIWKKSTRYDFYMYIFWHENIWLIEVCSKVYIRNLAYILDTILLVLKEPLSQEAVLRKAYDIKEAIRSNVFLFILIA